MYLRLRSPGTAALGAYFLGLSASTSASAQSAEQSAEALPPLVVESDLIIEPKKRSKKASKDQDIGNGVVPAQGTVVQSANRAPMDAVKVGSSVSIVTEKDIASQSRTYLKDYLELLPGVNFSQNGPPGTTTTISIRGASARYVKVLVDGMDVSDPSGSQTATSFEHLLVGDVSRIELLKGSQSTLYGGDAVAGVVSIDTFAATTLGFSQHGNVEYGAYNTFRGNHSAGYMGADGSNVSFTVQRVDTDGFSAASVGSEDDGYRNLTLSGRSEYYVSPTMKVFFAARTLDAEFHYDGYPPPAYTLDDTSDYGLTEQHAGRVGTEFSLLGGAFQNTFAIQGMKVSRDLYADGVSTGWYDGDRVKGEYKGTLSFNKSLALMAGADWERTGASNSTSARETSDLAGAYAQLVMEPIEGLVLTGGGRLDEHSEFGSFNTYRLTGTYLIPGTGTKLHASVGTGFRVPSLYELYHPTYGSTDLTPEESDSWDAGIEQGFWHNRLRLSLTYFELDTDNLIQWAYSGYYNIPGVTHREGIEIAAVAELAPDLTMTAAYTNVSANEENGSRLIRVPRHNFVVGVDAKPLDHVELNVTAKYVADTLDDSYDARGILSLDDYVLLSAKAAYEFMPGWKAYVRGENLLDEDYETIIDYGTAGVSVYGGLQMAFDN